MSDAPILPTADEAIEHFTQPDSPYDAFTWALVNEVNALRLELRGVDMVKESVAKLCQWLDSPTDWQSFIDAARDVRASYLTHLYIQDRPDEVSDE